MNPSIPTDIRPTHASVVPTSDDAPSASRKANYIVDVIFIVLLAAPFLIFEAPASWQDAVLSTRATSPAIVSTANAQAPAAAVRDDYGPE